MSVIGIVGRKLGMTQVFGDEGEAIPVTVVEAGPCTVTQVKTEETDGYTAVQLAFGESGSTNKPMRGHLEKAGVSSAEVVTELRYRTPPDELPELGSEITCGAFDAGQIVDVTGTSKGKGFAGVMRRHNFRGMGTGHGVKRKDRHPGAIGACATPGRTFPGKRMAGRTGGQTVTIQNLEVVEVDTDRDLLLVKGGVPGSDGGILVVRPAVRAPASAQAGARAGATQAGES